MKSCDCTLENICGEQSQSVVSEMQYARSHQFIYAIIPLKIMFMQNKFASKGKITA